MYLFLNYQYHFVRHYCYLKCHRFLKLFYFHQTMGAIIFFQQIFFLKIVVRIFNLIRFLNFLKIFYLCQEENIFLCIFFDINQLQYSPRMVFLQLVIKRELLQVPKHLQPIQSIYFILQDLDPYNKESRKKVKAYLHFYKQLRNQNLLILSNFILVNHQ